MTTALKIGIGATLGTGIIGSAIGIGYSFAQDKVKETKTTPKSLLQALAGEDFEELNTAADNPEHDKEWGELVKKYLNPGNIEKISLTTAITDGDNNISQNIVALKEGCKTLLKTTSDFEKNKPIAKNWCNKLSTLISKLTGDSVLGS